MAAGIREFAIIVNPGDREAFRRVLGTGARFGIEITYIDQPKPSGILNGILCAREWLEGSLCCVLLGDNIFFEADFSDSARAGNIAEIFTVSVPDPSRYGTYIPGPPARIVEKPLDGLSGAFAIPGLYFYDASMPDHAQRLVRDAQGREVSISDLNNSYLEAGQLEIFELGGDRSWYDAGTPQDLLSVANRARALPTFSTDGLPEAVAFGNGWISPGALEATISESPDSSYMQRLWRLL